MSVDRPGAIGGAAAVLVGLVVAGFVAGGAVATTNTATQVQFEGATVSGQVLDSTGGTVGGAVVYTDSFVVPTNNSVPGTISESDQHRFTVSPTGGLSAGAVDDPSDTFTVTRQRWDGSGWVDVNSATVTRANLTNYTFPASDFPDVTVNVSGGVQLVEVNGGSTSAFALDPAPAVGSDTGAASTEYTVRAVAYTGSDAGATGTGVGTAKPGFTATANVALSGNSSCSLSSLVQQYDADSDCAISIGELGQASSDYATGAIGIQQLGQVSAAYAST